jgi:uncharacterized damage-inducible protein DinB
MAYTLENLIEGLNGSRANFFKHLDGLKDDQWNWQPYPQCKTIRETLAHLVVVDRGWLFAFETGGMPDWDNLFPDWQPYSPEQLRTLLLESRVKLLDYLKGKYADAPLDTEISIYGTSMKLGDVVGSISSEDYYHTGQATFIRMASDPTWDYYAAIYNM